MPQNRPMPGELYRHFKNKMYQVIAVATHSETREKYVVYQALYGDFQTYVRPYDMFISEVDRKKYPDVRQKYRFAYAGTPGVAPEDISAERKDLGAEGAAAAQIAGDTESAAEDFGGVDRRLLAFLDAESYEEKLEILSSMENEIDDHLINQMAASLDVIIEDGPRRGRVEQLKRCIRMRLRYELGR